MAATVYFNEGGFNGQVTPPGTPSARPARVPSFYPPGHTTFAEKIGIAIRKTLDIIKNMTHIVTFGCLIVAKAMYRGVLSGVADVNAL